MKHLTRLYILFCWTFLVFVLLTMPMAPSTGGVSFTWYDKGLHAFLFGVMTYLCGDFLVLFRLNIRFVVLLSVIFSLIFSGAMEYLQLFVPGRSMSEYDFLAGAIGIFIASIFIYERFGKSKKKA